MSTTIAGATAQTSDVNLASYWSAKGLTLVETFIERGVVFVFDDPRGEAGALARQFRCEDGLSAFVAARGRMAAAIAATRAAGRCDRAQLVDELARRGWAR
jgi:hypothetical protein